MSDEIDMDELMLEDMPLWHCIERTIPDLEGFVLFYEKDREPFGWKARGRVRKNVERGWEVENVNSGTLEMVLPYEVIKVEPGESEPKG